MLTTAQEKLAQATQQATGEAARQQQPPPAGQLDQPVASGSGPAVQLGTDVAAEAAVSGTDGVSSPMDVDPPGMHAPLTCLL